MSSVASGPRKIEATHHRKPLRFFACASPALRRDKVPQPTKNWVFCMFDVPFFQFRFFRVKLCTPIGIQRRSQ